MASKTATLAHERAIVNALKENPKSMKALSEELGIQYYTVRRIIAGLVERNIATVDSVIDRHTVYTYSGDEKNHDYIPFAYDIISKQSFKINSLLEATGREERLASTKAAMRLLHHVSTLMFLAIQAEQGHDISKALDKVRNQMTKDRLLLSNALKMYEQITKEPRFWHPDELAKMLKDPDFNYHQVMEARQHFENHPLLNY